MLILYVFGGSLSHWVLGALYMPLLYTSYMQGITDDDHMWQLIDGCHSVVYVTRTSRIYLQMIDLTCMQIAASL